MVQTSTVPLLDQNGQFQPQACTILDGHCRMLMAGDEDAAAAGVRVAEKNGWRSYAQMSVVKDELFLSMAVYKSPRFLECSLVVVSLDENQFDFLLFQYRKQLARVSGGTAAVHDVAHEDESAWPVIF